MLVFLIGFSIWVPFRQADEIEMFTRSEPTPVTTTELSEHEVEAANLVARLTTFGEQVLAGEDETQIELTPADLNLAVARFPALEELRGTFHVRDIVDDEMRIDINYRLNGRPRLTQDGEDGFVTADPRYLVGTIHGGPLLTGGELALRVERLEVPGTEVPAGFLGHFSTLRLFERSAADPELGPVMRALTRAELRDGHLVLARIPGEQPPDTVSDEAFRSGGSKMATFLGAGFAAFLLLAGIVLFLGYRAQMRKLAAAEETSPPGDDA